MKIRTSYPGQEVCIVEAPQHLVDQFHEAQAQGVTLSPPFIEFIFDLAEAKPTVHYNLRPS